MSKKLKVSVAALVAILLLTVGGTAMVMADEEPTVDLPAGANVTLAKVAEILDIPQEELVSILRQAWQEVRGESIAMEECSVCQENANRFQAQQTEKWQERAGEGQAMGRRFQGNREEGQKTGRFRVSQAVRGQQMIAVPKGWNGSR
ncbi:hypothetical protein ACFLUZ_01985 [Chloroflexota bacterium]